MFDHLVGNDHIKKYLSRMIAKEAIGNSLLFAGPDGVGKSQFALAFAHMLIGKEDGRDHPDIHIYKPEGKLGMHSIASMREFSEEVYLVPYEAKKKVFIIHDADRMLTYSANALLKTFEEPAQDAIIVLLSSRPSKLIPTVLSRCRRIHFHAISADTIAEFLSEAYDCPVEQSRLIAAQAHGSIGKAVRLLQQGSDKIRDTLLQILVKGRSADYLQVHEDAAALAALIEEAKTAASKEVEEELQKHASHMTAVQKESMEKELDGAASMKQADISASVFEDILGWYRDLHLHHLGGRKELLCHPDSLEQLEQELQRGDLPDLEIIQEHIQDAKLSLERSTSLPICLENLFLRLAV